MPAAFLGVLALLPYVDRNPATEARHRRLAISIFLIVMTIAVVLTVIGLAFRGPGWRFVPPWDHNYIEM